MSTLFKIILFSKFHVLGMKTCYPFSQESLFEYAEKFGTVNTIFWCEDD